MVHGDQLHAPDVSSDELMQSMPQSVRDTFPAWGWTLEALWSVRRPSRSVDVDKFDWLLDVRVWRWQGRRFQVTLHEVLRSPDVYHAHVDKAMASDICRPINVATHRGRMVILDGYHRLLRVLIEGRTTIDVIEVSATDFDHA